MTNRLVKLIKRNDLLSEYVFLLNGYLSLTDRQAQVLSELLDLSLSTNSNILTKDNRRKIVDKTGVGYSNLSTILSLLKQKGVLTNQDKVWRVADQYLPQIDKDNCYVNLVLKLE
jgi:hypothetical protein